MILNRESTDKSTIFSEDDSKQRNIASEIASQGAEQVNNISNSLKKISLVSSVSMDTLEGAINEVVSSSSDESQSLLRSGDNVIHKLATDVNLIQSNSTTNKSGLPTAFKSCELTSIELEAPVPLFYSDSLMNKKIAQKVPNLGVQKNLKDVYPVKHKKKRRVTSDVYKQNRLLNIGYNKPSPNQLTSENVFNESSTCQKAPKSPDDLKKAKKHKDQVVGIVTQL